MQQLLFDLKESLHTGFIDHLTPSKKEYLPEFLTNDKINGRKVLSTIHKELNECDEFWFSVAFVTKSGVITLINLLKELEERGIKGKVLVSQYLNFTQPEALKTLLLFTNIDLKILVEGEFHAKGYLFKKGNSYNLIIGSSNLTANALGSNKEWNLKISATKDSKIINDAVNEFSLEFNNAKSVDNNFICDYEIKYKARLKLFEENENVVETFQESNISPNKMQLEALDSLRYLRTQQKDKALLISATGTGKTFLSAFDVKEIRPRTFLFIVHRENIAKAALKSFRKIFGDSKKMGLYTGTEKINDADFIFSTIQTISRDYHLLQFKPEHFEYIVYDETHRIGGDTYQKLHNYFKPKFLLGMTATPERTDGLDVYKHFDYNIAYEIRLHRALSEDMLCPFHYFGVTDISVNGKILEESSDFRLLAAEERVDRIIEKAKFYGCDDGKVRGLVFCSRIEECEMLSEQFNLRGYKTVSLSGSASEELRAKAINDLESDDESHKIDYIFTVDIFNEGVDIPRVNQIILLRPTKSAIVFVQQLGRGLRKTEGKEYLTVIDFIGNYNNNYMVPIALYGDTSFNKDKLRRLLASGSDLIPGSSTVNFDRISKEKIFEAINTANLQLRKDLVNDYKLLKLKIGKIPTMIDFIEHGSRDPQHYIEYSKSYYNFVEDLEDSLKNELSKREKLLLELFSNEISNGKRIEEVLILEELISMKQVSEKYIRSVIVSQYDVSVSNETIDSAIKNLNFEFVTVTENKKRITAAEKHNIRIIETRNGILNLTNEFKQALDNTVFFEYLNDLLAYGKSKYKSKFEKTKYFDGFLLYQKYSRKDVFRILNWEKNPVAQNVGGYIFDKKKTNCAIFVNYDKEEDISETTKYHDRFINNYEFEWMSKSKRNLDSPDIANIRNYKQGLRLPLFIKKSNDEGTEFYYMGDITPILDSFEETYLKSKEGQKVSVVKIRFRMDHPVEDSIYQYLTTSTA